MRALQSLFLLLPLALACSSSIPDPPAGDRISGTIRYQGTMTEHFSHPALQVVASIDFPPTSIPHGFLLIDRPNFSSGVAYELAYLPRQAYKVAAQIADLDNAALDDGAKPLGGYPDSCTLLLSADAGLVEVRETEATVGIDFQLYDQMGMEDPCWQAIP